MHAFILIAALLCATTWTAAAANETLKIGVIGPMSGPAAQWGVEIARGAEMKAEEINAAGGLKIGNATYDIRTIPPGQTMTLSGNVTSCTPRASSPESIPGHLSSRSVRTTFTWAL